LHFPPPLPSVFCFPSFLVLPSLPYLFRLCDCNWDPLAATPWSCWFLPSSKYIQVGTAYLTPKRSHHLKQIGK
jgi:hypothetical protein